MSRAHSIEHIQELIKSIHGDVVVLDAKTYVSVNKRARFIDRDYGEWWTKPEKVIYRKQDHKNKLKNNKIL